jgi:heat shock protein HslJ
MIKSTIALTLAGLLFVACGDPAVVGGGTTQPSDITGAWELTSGTVDGDAIPREPGYPITLTLEPDRMGGTAACNGYGGSYQAGDGTITFGDISITEMGCDGGVMDSEAAYMAALLLVDGYQLGDDGLALTGPGVELSYKLLPPVPTSELVGTVWILDGLIDGDSVSSTMGDEATLELFTDGSLIGSTGCRTLTGTYVVTGASVEFTDFAAEGDCPAELADQDGQVVTVLGDGFRVEIDGNQMIVSSVGEEGLVYKARP